MNEASELAKEYGSRLRSVTPDDVMNALGLEPRRSAVEMTAAASAWFAAGLLVGAGLALLLVPPRTAGARGSVGYSGVESGSRPLTQM
jgi:hypothetical protein